MQKTHYSSLTCLFFCLILLGCGNADGVYPVSGTVKFDDGSVPGGELPMIKFTPVTRTPTAQVCSGSIQPDGSFIITTFQPEDGALPGEYKVTFEIYKTYTGRELLVAPEYADVEKTPEKATVKTSGNKFDFKIKKNPAAM
jgi:hypothetical protein